MSVLPDAYNYVNSHVYLKFLFIVLVSLVAAWIGRQVLRRVLKPLAKKTKTKIDDLIFKSLTNIFFYIILVIGLRIAVHSLEKGFGIGSHFVDTALVIIVCILIIRIINNFAQHWLENWKDRTKTSADERMIPLLRKILSALVIILGGFFIFDTWGVNISPLLATAGVAGLAFGLAIKDTLSNIFGGLQLVLDKTFKVGDRIKLDSGETCVVIDIGLRSTKLRTFDNEVIFIPNGILANAKIINITQPDMSVRVNVNFGVEYGSDTDRMRMVVIEAVKSIELVEETPVPAVHFMGMGDFSLDFIARVWVKDYNDAYNTKLEATDRIY
ncbi:MAG: mechanosensitive ion channel family protein, partial [Candidatus Aminicenantes bacterium]|nr:mechanosensitive ion channel family protein [Candidatus Aminicenantes bacterium]